MELHSVHSVVSSYIRSELVVSNMPKCTAAPETPAILSSSLNQCRWHPRVSGNTD